LVDFKFRNRFCPFADFEDDDLDEAASQGGPRPGRYVMAAGRGDELSQSMEDLSLQQQYRPGGHGIHRPVAGVHSGFEYKSAKAKGDIKKKGRLDPYAYIPLSGALLNKRSAQIFFTNHRIIFEGDLKNHITFQKSKICIFCILRGIIFRKRAKNAGKLLQLEKSASKGVAKGLKARAKAKRTNSFKKSK